MNIQIQIQIMPQEQEPFIPPYYMLILAVIGFIVALVLA